MTPETPRRLYHRPSSDYWYRTPREVFDADIAPHPFEPSMSGQVGYMVEEWSVVNPLDHLPAPDRIVEFITEWATECGDIDEGMSEEIDDVTSSADVIATVEFLLALIARRVDYRMANTLITTEDFFAVPGRAQDLKARANAISEQIRTAMSKVRK